jgi:hypothetical protein
MASSYKHGIGMVNSSLHNLHVWIKDHASLVVLAQAIEAVGIIICTGDSWSNLSKCSVSFVVVAIGYERGLSEEDLVKRDVDPSPLGKLVVGNGRSYQKLILQNLVGVDTFADGVIKMLCNNG